MLLFRNVNDSDHVISTRPATALGGPPLVTKEPDILKPRHCRIDVDAQITVMKQCHLREFAGEATPVRQAREPDQLEMDRTGFRGAVTSQGPGLDAYNIYYVK